MDKEIFALAMPVFIGQAITASAGLVGRVIVSRPGTEAFNGINVGMMAFMLIITIIKE